MAAQNTIRNFRPRTIAHAVPATRLLLLFLSAHGVFAGDRVVVDRVGPDDLLKLRAGPGLGFRILLGLPDGTASIRRDYVTEMGQPWYRVALTGAPPMTGYVSADYFRPP